MGYQPGGAGPVKGWFPAPLYRATRRAILVILYRRDSGVSTHFMTLIELSEKFDVLVRDVHRVIHGL